MNWGMWHLKSLMLSAVIATVQFSGEAVAQATSFPSKPVTLVVLLAPGGAIDVEMRLYTPKMQELLVQPLIVDFKLGAGGLVAGTYVAKSAPDGYTLLVINNAYSTFPALYKDLPFDLIKDFAPLSLMNKRPSLLMVSPTFPAKTYAEYIAYARANPGKFNYATSGPGTGSHLAGAWLHSATNTKVTFVHYKGTGSLIPNLMAGRLDGIGVAMPVAKKLQRPWEMGKSFDQSCPVSAVQPVAKIGHPVKGAIWLKVNGQTKQSGDLGKQIWPVDEAIAFLSSYVELAPGDRLEGHIDAVGDLVVNYAVSAAKRAAA